ncbi:hypothetical protein LSAT2_016551, partial [Lamellibrachia satsuma]
MEGLTNFVSTSFDVRRLLAGVTSDRVTGTPDALGDMCRGDTVTDNLACDRSAVTRDKSLPSPGSTSSHENTMTSSLSGKAISLHL